MSTPPPRRNLIVLVGLALVLAAIALVISATSLFGVFAAPGPAAPAPAKSDPANYAVSLVERAMQRYADEGREATLSYYNSPESVDGEWYVFIDDENGLVAAVGADPSLVGQDLRGDFGVDITGYRFGDAVLATDENGRWVDYLFLNPRTGTQEFKHSWVVKRDGLIFGSGWYQVAPFDIPDKSSPSEYTVSLVDDALERYDTEGRETAIAYYNSPESVDGEWYVFIIDENDQPVAHANPAILGRNLKGDLGVDVTGYRFGDAMLAATEEGRWVDYVFENLTTGNQEFKHSWVVRRDGLIFGSGWYQVAPFDIPDKSSPSEYTVSLVDDALERYDTEGRETAIAYYNSPESVDGEWYVFIIDENDQPVAHTNPAILGRNLKGDLGVDVTGYRFGDAMLAATEEGRWVDYVFENLTTGNQEFKHSWVVRRDGLIFGSGWYQVLPTSPLDAAKSDPAEYSVAVVDRAIRYYKAHGRAGAVEYFNSPESVDGPWYVFMVDEDKRVIANRDQSLVGRDVSDLGADVNGKNLGEIEVTEAGRWVDYVFVNPATGEEGFKHSWAVLHDGIIIGSGWYE